MPLKLFKTFKWGEKFKITRVRYEDGVQLFEKGDTTGNTVYINQDNMYIVDQEQIDNIYNALKDLEFYSFEGECIIDPALDTGDIVVIDGKNVIYQGSMQFSGRWIAGIESKIQCKAKEETTTRTPSQKTINRRVQSQINQAEGKITQLTEETTENSEKITQQEQDIDSLKSKVSNIQDLTRTIVNNRTVTLENCAKGDLLSLRIKGNNTVFKYLYPSDNLSPADDLFPMGDSRISVIDKDNNETVYELGVTDVLRQNGEVYDEFVLEGGQAKVIRRINSDGTVKTEPTTEDLGELSILLNEGTNTIKILNYTAEITAKYAIKNNYTDIFATRAEMNSSIAQSAEAINTEVNKKIDKEELGTEIEQNYEHVKIAWNQIAEYIQMMIINGNVSLAVLDEIKNVLMSLDKNGQHFYDSSKNKIGDIGVINYQDIPMIAFNLNVSQNNNKRNGLGDRKERKILSYLLYSRNIL